MIIESEKLKISRKLFKTTAVIGSDELASEYRLRKLQVSKNVDPKNKKTALSQLMSNYAFQNKLHPIIIKDRSMPALVPYNHEE